MICKPDSVNRFAGQRELDIGTERTGHRGKVSGPAGQPVRMAFGLVVSMGQEFYEFRVKSQELRVIGFAD